MKGLRTLLRYLLVWWVSIPITVVVVLCAFVFWLASTQSGARMLMSVVAQQFDGRAENVNGSVLGGLQVGRLQLVLPDTSIDVTDLRLAVNWRALSDRLVQVHELSASSLDVALTTPTDEPTQPAEDDAPFSLPELPVKIAVDRFALGVLTVTQDGEPLPVGVRDIALSLAADDHGARLNVQSLSIAHDQVAADLRGQVALQQMSAPWPINATVDIDARSVGEDSPLCASRMLTDKLKEKGATPTTGCAATVQIQADGSLEGMNVRLDGTTADGALKLLAQAGLALDQPFPLRTAHIDLRLADKSGVAATFDRQPVPQQAGVDRVTATLDAQRLNIGDLVGDVIPPALLSTKMNIEAEVANVFDLKAASVQATIAEGSRWNKQSLSGKISGRVEAPNLGVTAAPTPAVATPATQTTSDPLAGFQLHDLVVDLKLGSNKVSAQGDLVHGKVALTLDADTPQLAAFWPDLPGGASLKAKLDGTLEQHKGQLSARYTPADSRADTLGRAPMRADFGFTGSWGKGPAGRESSGTSTALIGWRGKIDRLTADSMGFAVALQPVTLSFLPEAQTPQWQWEVGATQLTLSLPDKQRAVIAHQGSRGGHGRWQTAGRADNLVITTNMVKQILSAVDPAAAAAEQAAMRKGGGQRRIALDASWDLKFAGALSGSARIARRDGDLMIPGDPPIPLGLTKLVLDVKATPTDARVSRLDVGLDAQTQKMGVISGSASAWLVADANGGMALDARRTMRANIQADIADLTWVDLFVGDTMEIRGKVQANIDAQGTLNGKWSTSGTIRGRDLRVVRIDDGVRLLEGTLDAHLDGTRLVLDSLRFPATLRVMPDEWRTKEWVTENPGAKGGYAEATGHWDLLTSQGVINLKLYRFPALQRSDRYAMVSGTVTVDAQLPRMAITGDLTADAGWFSLEILQGVPSLDDDVHVIKPGETAAAKSSPIQMTMNLKFDMGPRFYITGMGLDAGLLGSLEIRMADGRLTGVGALRTRGGGIEAYGQKLRLRRGTLTFQGQLDNPLLDILALRTGEQVEAGVQVLGTARRPKIDLVSYPDVSDVEKLSWLLLGRGPDQSGGDTALLLSIGTALLGGGGPPFYKQFGLDDVSIRSGAIGSSGSLLPDNTVASDINTASDSDLATQFLVASKTFANGITLSVEQAMAGSATVGRASYELSRRWSVDLKGGTVNGLSLIYRTFFSD